MASVYEDWSDRGGMDVELWWPDFTRESTLWGRILRNSEIREVSSREVPLPEEERERDLFTIYARGMSR